MLAAWQIRSERERQVRDAFAALEQGAFEADAAASAYAVC
jgi:hypothetical protein